MSKLIVCIGLLFSYSYASQAPLAQNKETFTLSHEANKFLGHQDFIQSIRLYNDECIVSTIGLHRKATFTFNLETATVFVKYSRCCPLANLLAYMGHVTKWIPAEKIDNDLYSVEPLYLNKSILSISVSKKKHSDDKKKHEERGACEKVFIRECPYKETIVAELFADVCHCKKTKGAAQ